MKWLLATLLATQAYALPTDLENMAGLRLVSHAPKEFVMFWGSWCEDCKHYMRTEFPKLKKLGYTVYGINVDSSVKKMNQCVEKEQLTDVYRETFKTLQKELKAFAVPHWAIYKDDKLVDSGSGINSIRGVK